MLDNVKSHEMKLPIFISPRNWAAAFFALPALGEVVFRDVPKGQHVERDNPASTRSTRKPSKPSCPAASPSSR
ncbi:hypothetical protein Cob_v008824 [Colletotrichum orbiculare MAFF 240422]|uniref:Uncharacterized protein n=1 Tax=Colletotrichum orbiculare (strain 104-T / ATCC 96160 / CBS 514.97 / LARS 414 / MAFF 240422) TaxID=1213857 RepID=A0A484FKQ2_COLOR|nr:hypothetical protein Cob_v008824 [Colletotrichum orbiculare MAFF 240422]